MPYLPLPFNDYENFGLLDTGAVQSAFSEPELRKIITAHLVAVLQHLPLPDYKTKKLTETWSL